MLIRRKDSPSVQSVLSWDCPTVIPKPDDQFNEDFPSLIYINIGSPSSYISIETFQSIVDQCSGKSQHIIIMGDEDPFFCNDLIDFVQYCAESGLKVSVLTDGRGVSKVPDLSMYRDVLSSAYVSFTNAYFCRYAAHQFISLGILTILCYNVNMDNINDITTKLRVSGLMFIGIRGALFLFDGPLTDMHLSEEIKSSKLASFFKAFNTAKLKYDVGIDSYSIPWMLNLYESTDTSDISGYESGRYSAFISSDMKMMPCTCDHDQKWAVDISDSTIESAWKSKKFEDFRNYMRYSCSTCPDRLSCLGGCPARHELTFCDRPEKDFTNKQKKG